MNRPWHFAAGLFLLAASQAKAETLFLVEERSCIFEFGKLSNCVDGGLKYRVDLELDGTPPLATVTEITRLDSGQVIDVDVPHLIAFRAAPGESVANAVAAEGKRDKLVFTAIGKPGNLAFEMFLVAGDRFEYSKASPFGYLNVASGRVERPISIEADTENFLKRLKKQGEIRTMSSEDIAMELFKGWMIGMLGTVIGLPLLIAAFVGVIWAIIRFDHWLIVTSARLSGFFHRQKNPAPPSSPTA